MGVDGVWHVHPSWHLPDDGMHLAVGADAGDLQVEPFHLDFDLHENPGMKKGTLTFEVSL